MAEMTFEQALERLEAVVQELERGDLPLERALALYEEGVNLVRQCQGQLDAAEGKMQKLLAMDEKGEATLEDLEGDEESWS